MPTRRKKTQRRTAYGQFATAAPRRRRRRPGEAARWAAYMEELRAHERKTLRKRVRRNTRRAVKFGAVRMYPVYGLRARGHYFGGSGYETKAEATKEARELTKELGTKVRVVKVGEKRYAKVLKRRTSRRTTRNGWSRRYSRSLRGKRRLRSKRLTRRNTRRRTSRR